MADEYLGMNLGFMAVRHFVHLCIHFVNTEVVPIMHQDLTLEADILKMSSYNSLEI